MPGAERSIGMACHALLPKANVRAVAYELETRHIEISALLKIWLIFASFLSFWGIRFDAGCDLVRELIKASWLGSVQWHRRLMGAGGN